MARKTTAAGCVYLIAAAIFTWPLTLHLHSLFGAVDPSGDPSLNLWSLGRDLHTLSTHSTPTSFSRPVTRSRTPIICSCKRWPFGRCTRAPTICLLLQRPARRVARGRCTGHARTGEEADGQRVGGLRAGLMFGFAPLDSAIRLLDTKNFGDIVETGGARWLSRVVRNS
jgi:hypothetical protein